jgi:dUTP pyrophosphatase
MKRVIVHLKRLGNNRDLPLPSYQSDGSSGLDLLAAIDKAIITGSILAITPVGITVSFPKGGKK